MDPRTHINELFADSLFLEFNKSRFGLEICKKHLDADYAYEMKKLYERAVERHDCHLPDNNCCCTLTAIEEQIKTL
jgi:hypothetical protein